LCCFRIPVAAIAREQGAGHVVHDRIDGAGHGGLRRIERRIQRHAGGKARVLHADFDLHGAGGSQVDFEEFADDPSESVAAGIVQECHECDQQPGMHDRFFVDGNDRGNHKQDPDGRECRQHGIVGSDFFAEQ